MYRQTLGRPDGAVHYSYSCSAFAMGPAILFLTLVSPSASLGQDIDFARQVRPILSDKCFACHGPDEEQRQADLRLDTEQGILQDLGGYAAVQRDNPAKSELLVRILADDDSVMPPEDHPKHLTDSEKEILRGWVLEGGKWAEHWAYEAPVASGANEADASDWGNNWIDQYVLRRLESEGVQPSDEANRRTLIRRLYFDLLGLPPTASEVEAFVEDSSPDAYEKLVNHLLKSPHFGERMAIYWLDLVRYADTVGYHGDQDVSVSPYRDYVIDAFNSNMPFDQFTREQIAGDLLQDATQSQLVASGYNKLGMMSAEGGVQPEEYLAKYAADRVRNASSVWLGSTMGCAECHDHKFDPFTMRDFYQMAAFFADLKERGLYSGANRDGDWGPYVSVADPILEKLLEPIDLELDRVRTSLDEFTPELRSAFEAWVSESQEQLRLWETASIATANALHQTKLDVREDGSLFASGPNASTNTYTLELDVADPLVGIRIDVLADDSLPQKGPGRAGNGNFVISEVRLFSVSNDDESVKVAIGGAAASFEQEAGNDNPYKRWSAESAIDDDVKGPSWGWAVLPETGKPQSLVLKLAEQAPAGRYRLVIEQNHTNPKHTLGAFRVSVAKPSETVSLEPDVVAKLVAAPEVLAALTAPAEDSSDEALGILQTHFLKITPALEEPRQRLTQLEEERKSTVAKHTRTSLISVAVDPREMRVLPRGNWMDQSGDIVKPGVPKFLPPIAERGSDDQRLTRLDLANWMVQEDHPLTSRVFVNRLWMLYFGTGLSKTVDDLGSQGESPSHPKLLDALAVDFARSGWNVKRAIKQIVMSATYRQSSLPRPELAVSDPYNRLLARQSRFRLDAELVRDNALAISGLLIRKVGGRSAKPYQPAGLYRHLNFPTRVYQADIGDQQYRRGLYTHWQRQFLHPALQAFDAPAREECTAQRPRSNTPLAALVLLNDPSYVEAARVFAERGLAQEASGDQEKLSWMMQEALSRLPTQRELAVLEQLLASEREAYKQAPARAKELTAIGQSEPGQQESVELAAWTMVARAIFNMHETITRN